MTWLRYPGYILIIIGISIFLLFIGLWISGSKLSIEPRSIYYGNVINSFLNYSFLLSILTFTIGSFLSSFRKYAQGKIRISDKGIIEINFGDEKIDLQRWQIGKIEVANLNLSKKLKYKISTTQNKVYYLKAKKELIDNLPADLKDKIRVKNTVLKQFTQITRIAEKSNFRNQEIKR